MAAEWWLPEEETEVDPWFVQDGRRWDAITIGDAVVPGIVDVKGKGGLKLDEKTPKGRSAVRWEFGGYSPYAFTITILLYRQQDWETYRDRIIPIARPRNPGKSAQRLPSPVDIAHPALRAYGIRRCLIKSLSLPESKGEDAKGRQIKTVTLECGEDFPVEWKKDPASASAGQLLKTSKPLPGLSPVVPNFQDNRSPSDTATLDKGMLEGGKALVSKTKKKADSKGIKYGPDPMVEQEP